MTLLTPQPSQSFWHVPPVGNSYHSGLNRRIAPLSVEDEMSLMALGCTVEEPVKQTSWRPSPSIDVVSSDASDPEVEA